MNIALIREIILFILNVPSAIGLLSGIFLSTPHQMINTYLNLAGIYYTFCASLQNCLAYIKLITINI